MRNKNVLFALLACILCSCQAKTTTPRDLVGSSGETTKPRVYEAFGSYTAEQAEEICKSYAERVGSSQPEHYYLKYDFGTYGNMHVNALKTEIPGAAEPCVIKPVSVAGYYICEFPYPSYHLNVWIEGEGSFDLETLYVERRITDEDIRSIMDKAEELRLRKHKTFDTKPEDFSFSLKWGFGVDTYDSKKELITVKGRANTYTASFRYPNLDALYEKVKALDIGSYPDTFHPYLEYGGMCMTSAPSTYYLLEVGGTSILGDDCPASRLSRQNLVPQGKKFLDLVFEIIDTIQDSDEYESIDIPQEDMMIFY